MLRIAKRLSSDVANQLIHAPNWIFQFRHMQEITVITVRRLISPNPRVRNGDHHSRPEDGCLSTPAAGPIFTFIKN